MDNLLLRSLLFVPAFNEKYIEKSLSCNADALVLDLEDSVPIDFRANARKVLRKYILSGSFKNHRVFVRLNSIDSNMVSEDLKYTLHQDIDGFMLSKIYTHHDIIYYDKLIQQLEAEHDIPNGHFKFAPLIETPAAVMDISKICNISNRTIAVCFGSADYLNNICCINEKNENALDFPRSMIVVAARAANVLPIDAPYFTAKDKDGFIKRGKKSFEMGFAGMLLLTPRQVEWANESFTPTIEEVCHAKKIIEAVNFAKKNGSGVVMLDDSMVGPPAMEQASAVVNLYNKIKSLHEV